ncbi:MAG: hypothetical protein ACLQBL_34570 [Polyangiaceae bacterium]|jgi:hypothetical protein
MSPSSKATTFALLSALALACSSSPKGSTSSGSGSGGGSGGGGTGTCSYSGPDVWTSDVSGAGGSSVQTGHYQGPAIGAGPQTVADTIQTGSSACPGSPLITFTIVSTSPAVASYPLTASGDISAAAGGTDTSGGLTAGQANLLLSEKPLSGSGESVWWATGGSVSITQTSYANAGTTTPCLAITFSDVPMAPADASYTGGANSATGTFTFSGTADSCAPL